MGKGNRRRHQLVGFAAGITEHNALVTRPFILIAAIGINALCNMCRLAVHPHHHFRILPMKPVLLIADILDRLAGQGFHLIV